MRRSVGDIRMLVRDDVNRRAAQIQHTCREEYRRFCEKINYGHDSEGSASGVDRAVEIESEVEALDLSYKNGDALSKKIVELSDEVGVSKKSFIERDGCFDDELSKASSWLDIEFSSNALRAFGLVVEEGVEAASERNLLVQSLRFRYANLCGTRLSIENRIFTPYEKLEKAIQDKTSVVCKKMPSFSYEASLEIRESCNNSSEIFFPLIKSAEESIKQLEEMARRFEVDLSNIAEIVSSLGKPSSAVIGADVRPVAGVGMAVSHSSGL